MLFAIGFLNQYTRLPKFLIDFYQTTWRREGQRFVDESAEAGH